MFELGGNTALLQFEGGSPLDGAEVRVSLDMTVRDFLSLQRTVAGIATDRESISEEQLTSIEAAFQHFADKALLEWNLSMNGEAVPANGEGMMSLPFRLANLIFGAWATVIADVSPNSNAASASGE